MIQRIQSIWLLFAALLSFAGLRLPFYAGMRTVSSAETNPVAVTQQMEFVNGNSNFILLLLSIAVFILPLVIIFLYKNRGTQIRLCLVSMFLEVGVLVSYFMEIKNFSSGALALTSILQAFVLFFLFLAIRGIRNDERIIRESERLR
jgi:hypothetical protein